MTEKTSDDKNQEVEKRLQKYLKYAVIFVVVVWAFTFLTNYFLFNNTDFNGGTLGDSFGMVNALFSGLAFAFLIYTSFMQKEELKLQRKELEENRAELKRSADAHREMVELNTRQLKINQELNQVSLIPRLHYEFKTVIKKDTYGIHLLVNNSGLQLIEIQSKRYLILNKEELIGEEFEYGAAILIKVKTKRVNRRSITLIFKFQGLEYFQRLDLESKPGRISNPMRRRKESEMK